MECEHIWIEHTIAHDNGGYMIMKFCHKCMDASGYGFLDKDHETAYLNSLYNTPDDMIK